MATEQLELTRAPERAAAARVEERPFKDALDRIHFTLTLTTFGAFLATEGMMIAGEVLQNDSLWNNSIFMAGAAIISGLAAVVTRPSFRRN